MEYPTSTPTHRIDSAHGTARHHHGKGKAPFAVVLRHWWQIDPNRPGAVWQYYLATAFYNTLIGLVLTLFFMVGDSRASLWDTLLDTVLISQCIGFCIHMGFDSFYTFTSDTWRSGLSATARRILHSLIAIAGVYVGYTVAYAFKGRNFLSILLAYPRAGMMILIVGILVSFVWFLVMDGQTRRLRAEADEAHAREAAAAAQKQASDAELRALQAQIEPHFLFNTLANVQALIDYEPTKARHMLESFIEYLRATLDASRRTQGSLGDEVAMLQRYLQLMQVRMGQRLHTEWDIDPSLLNQPLAPLLLQPLVENAIKYGLEPKIEGGRIFIRASRQGDRVRIEVQDDGVGQSSHAGARKPQSSGTGLKNVLARLKSTCGENATLSIASTPEGYWATLEFDDQTIPPTLQNATP